MPINLRNAADREKQRRQCLAAAEMRMASGKGGVKRKGSTKKGGPSKTAEQFKRIEAATVKPKLTRPKSDFEKKNADGRHFFFFVVRVNPYF
jgi:hypothetical protein